MGYNVLVDEIYSGYKSLILTFDPNFQRDIQVYSLPNTFQAIFWGWGFPLHKPYISDIQLI